MHFFSLSFFFLVFSFTAFWPVRIQWMFYIAVQFRYVFYDDAVSYFVEKDFPDQK